MMKKLNDEVLNGTDLQSLREAVINEVSEIMHNDFGYITFAPNQLIDFVAKRWNTISDLDAEIAAGYFADYLLASGQCEVME